MTSLTRITATLLAHLCCSTVFLQPSSAAVNYLIDGGKYDIDFIANFTKYLHSRHRFNSFVCFCENRERNRSPRIVVRTLEHTLVEDFGAPIIVWGQQRTAKLRNIIGLNNLVFVNIASVDDPVLEVVDYTLDGLHFMSMLFIYKSADNVPPNKQQIHDFFSWCWSKNMVNVALTFHIIKREWVEANDRFEYVVYNHVYNYSPFPVVTVFNLTSLIYTRHGGFVVDKIADTRGYEFRTPISLDPPSVFLTSLKVHQQGESAYTITGTAGRLYQKFIEHLNGSIKIIPKHNISFYAFHRRYVLEASKKRIDIGIHPYSELLQFANLTEGSYPIGQTNACVIVPVMTDDKQSNVLLSSSLNAHGLLMGRLVGLALLQLLSNEPFYINPRRIGQALWNAYGTALLQPLPITQMQHRRKRFLFIHLLAIQLNFILVNTYIASLAAIFSTTPLGKQISSVDDFLQSDLKILLHEYERKIYFELDHLPAALMSRLHVTDAETLSKHRDALNTSYAYVATGEMWTMLNMQQQRLSRPRFRIAGSGLCTPKFFLKFPVQWDSPFVKSLAVFFMYTQESGLSLKWERLSTREAIEMKLIQIIGEKSKHPVSLNFYHIEPALFICIDMLICSLLCFFGELICHWWMVRKNRRLERRQKRRHR